MRLLLPLICLVFSARAGLAQLAPPNAAGVAMGHLHLYVDDVGAEQAFWVRLGGNPVGADPAGSTVVAMPGVLILLTERDADGETLSLLDHVAFRVASLAAIEARGFELELLEAFPGIASIHAPSGLRVELFEEGTATNVGFEPAIPDNVAERHNRPLVGAIDSHHLHFYLPDAAVDAARDWYVETFGAIPGDRWRYAAADLPGMNLNFSATDPARPATSGRSLDHIGFAIDDLASFVAQLESRGISLDVPLTRDGLISRAELTDPWGTRIVLTEGLGRY